MMENPGQWKRDSSKKDDEVKHQAMEDTFDKVKTVDQYISGLAFERRNFVNEYMFIQERINNLKYLKEPDQDLMFILRRYRSLIQQLISINDIYIKNTYIKVKKINPDDAEGLSKIFGENPDDVAKAEIISHEPREGIDGETEFNLISNRNNIEDQLEDLKKELLTKYPTEYKFFNDFSHRETTEN